eukprot:3941936-Rhodomonas_salina.1
MECPVLTQRMVMLPVLIALRTSYGMSGTATAYGSGTDALCPMENLMECPVQTPRMVLLPVPIALRTSYVMSGTDIAFDSGTDVYCPMEILRGARY